MLFNPYQKLYWQGKEKPIRTNSNGTFGLNRIQGF